MLKSPVGTLTFLMTDVEGSTRLWEEYPAAMTKGIIRHEAIIHDVVTSHDGYHVIEQGEGDSTLSVFKDATQAARAADEIRQQLAVEKWADGLVIRVRIGLHSGVADMRQQTYYGRVVNRAARVRAVAHPGQVIITSATRELLDPKVFPTLKDHGPQRLKDLLQPEHLFELPTDEAFPPLQTLSRRPTNLPVQLTSFVGRLKDIEAVRERLTRGRLVTLLGPGGCGKTRLALQVAAEAVDDYPDGVFFADLASAAGEEDVLAAVLKSTRCEELGALRQSASLIVLDNCEHIVRLMAGFVKNLLSTSDSLLIVATSREPLLLMAEITYRVPSLSLPAEKDVRDLAKCAKAEAVQLFVDRASAKVPDFELTDKNCVWIGLICRRLDGIALAIELAAPRLKILTPEQLYEKLEDRFKILKTAGETEAGRHRTLLATIDYSYDLLAPTEQRLFRALGVFRGDWTLEAAEAIASDAESADTSEILEALHDKSMIQSTEGEEQMGRFLLLESLKAYAFDKLIACGETEATFTRLACWCQAIVENAANHEGQERTSQLDREVPNIHRALEWCIESSAMHLGLAIAIGMWPHWREFGRFTEGRRFLRIILARDELPEDMRAAGWSIFGAMAWYQADYSDAQKGFSNGLALYKQLNNLPKVVASQNNLGLLAAAQGKCEQARTHLQKAKRGFQKLGDQENLATVLLNLGAAEMETGRLEDAEASFREAVGLIAHSTSGLSSCVLYCNLALLAVVRSRISDAVMWAEKAALQLSEKPEQSAIPLFLSVMAEIAAAGNKLFEAATLGAAEDAFAREMGLKPLTSLIKRDALLRDNLPPGSLQTACRAGGALDLQDALELSRKVLRDIPVG